MPTLHGLGCMLFVLSGCMILGACTHVDFFEMMFTCSLLEVASGKIIGDGNPPVKGVLW